MNKNIIILFILISIPTILLAGCSSATIATVSANNGLSTATKLVLGTLKLEDTSQAVTAAQATELITLWEGYESLSNSDTTSQVELEALIKQIQSTMTTDQITTIEAMDLTDQSVSEVMQSLGSSVNASAPVSTQSSSAINQAAPAGGPGGMPGGGGDSVMSAISGGMDAQSTPAAMQSTTNASNTQVNPMLLNVLIQLLQTRSQMAG